MWSQAKELAPLALSYTLICVPLILWSSVEMKLERNGCDWIMSNPFRESGTQLLWQRRCEGAQPGFPAITERWLQILGGIGTSGSGGSAHLSVSRSRETGGGLPSIPAPPALTPCRPRTTSGPCCRLLAAARPPLMTRTRRLQSGLVPSPPLLSGPLSGAAESAPKATGSSPPPASPHLPRLALGCFFSRQNCSCSTCHLRDTS